ncbi:MAG TPA: hypothetical protein VH278_08965 [Burkholderiaceae bacterium]|jgi:hypothetical protein|nr:hypothetical protein [Burkholderiaceae bacterium]
MGARERSFFELTLKGTEELTARTYRLDAKTRNILFLIQRGYATVDGILDNSIFPRDEVVERLRELLRGHFLTLETPDNALSGPVTGSKHPEPTPAPPPQAVAPEVAPDPETEQPDEPIFFGL